MNPIVAKQGLWLRTIRNGIV